MKSKFFAVITVAMLFSPLMAVAEPVPVSEAGKTAMQVIGKEALSSLHKNKNKEYVWCGKTLADVGAYLIGVRDNGSTNPMVKAKMTPKFQGVKNEELHYLAGLLLEGCKK